MQMDTGIARVSGSAIVVRGADLDTDRIIPARFMKVITFDGLGEYAFYDERYDDQGNERPHPFNDATFAGASILVVGTNFGCGSSREHAPQALMRYGIRAIVGVSFAEIFAGNCTALGIPVAAMSADRVDALMDTVEARPDAKFTVDLETLRITGEDDDVSIDEEIMIPEDRRRALVSGAWDSTATLLEAGEAIERTSDALPYIAGFVA